jgi:hypothetical protein
MATTCKLIQKISLGSAAATMEFASIPATHTDLLLTISGRGETSATYGQLIWLRFNGVTTSTYSYRVLEAYDSTAASSSTSSTTIIGLGQVPTPSQTSSTFGNCEVYIPNYAGSTNKSTSSSLAQETNASTGWVINAVAGLWSNTAAIDKITLTLNSGNWSSGSSAYLYGITKA